MQKLPVWKLTDLYKNINDPKIKKAFQNNLNQASAFEKKYRGEINNSIHPEFLLEAIKEYESILQESVKPYFFAELLFSADSTPQENGAFLQQAQTKYIEIYQKLIFFQLEILKLKTEVFKKLINSSLLVNYKHFLEKLLRSKPHRLPETEEKILNEKSLTGQQAFIRLFEQELSLKQFKIKLGKKEKVVNESQVLNLLYSANRKERKEGARSLTQGLKEEARRMTFITNILLQDKEIDDRYLHFKTPEEARLEENDIDKKTIETMIDVITQNYAMVSEFYSFKKKVLKLSKLYDYDRYAPIPINSQAQIPFEKAKKIVLDSFFSFSPVFFQIAHKFFENQWIDAQIRKGKSGGAFCSYTTSDLHPYVLLSYTKNTKDVLTLGHELGHGVHAYLAKKQPYLNFDMPLVLAETASVFAEMVVFRNLQKTLKKRNEVFSLNMQIIESIFATVFRQTAMYKFEQEVHKARKKEGELTTDQINKIWIVTQKEMFGNSIELTPNYDYWWSYIPHFKKTPFYVYAYAFGELATLSLYARYQEHGRGFVEQYLDILASGGSRSPQDLFSPLGIELKEKKFWLAGIKIIQNLIEETKALY